MIEKKTTQSDPIKLAEKIRRLMIQLDRCIHWKDYDPTKITKEDWANVFDVLCFVLSKTDDLFQEAEAQSGGNAGKGAGESVCRAFGRGDLGLVDLIETLRRELQRLEKLIREQERGSVQMTRRDWWDFSDCIGGVNDHAVDMFLHIFITKSASEAKSCRERIAHGPDEFGECEAVRSYYFYPGEVHGGETRPHDPDRYKKRGKKSRI